MQHFVCIEYFGKAEKLPEDLEWSRTMEITKRHLISAAQKMLDWMGITLCAIFRTLFMHWQQLSRISKKNQYTVIESAAVFRTLASCQIVIGWLNWTQGLFQNLSTIQEYSGLVKLVYKDLKFADGELSTTSWLKWIIVPVCVSISLLSVLWICH